MRRVKERSRRSYSSFLRQYTIAYASFSVVFHLISWSPRILLTHDRVFYFLDHLKEERTQTVVTGVGVQVDWAIIIDVNNVDSRL